MTRAKNEIEEIVNNLGYELLDEYIPKNKIRRVTIRDINGYKYDVSFVNLITKNVNPCFVHPKNCYSLENISLWLKQNNKNFELCEDNEYTHNENILKLYHSICDEYFYMSWDCIKKGQNCSVCSGRQIGKHNNLAYLRSDLVCEWIKSKKGLTPYDVSEFSNEDVYWQCKDCEHKWWALITTRTKQKSNCPKCAESQIESKVATQLKEYILKKYTAETEYKIFKNPKTNRYLPYDIYIYDGIFIEIHGLQHYKFNKNKFFKNKEEFEYRQYLDKLKKDYAENNGIYIEIDLRKIKTISQAIDYVENILNN